MSNVPYTAVFFYYIYFFKKMREKKRANQPTKFLPTPFSRIYLSYFFFFFT